MTFSRHFHWFFDRVYLYSMSTLCSFKPGWTRCRCFNLSSCIVINMNLDSRCIYIWRSPVCGCESLKNLRRCEAVNSVQHGTLIFYWLVSLPWLNWHGGPRVYWMFAWSSPCTSADLSSSFFTLTSLHFTSLCVMAFEQSAALRSTLQHNIYGQSVTQLSHKYATSLEIPWFYRT